MKMSADIEKNLTEIDKLFKDCQDIKSRTMSLGREANVSACIFYVEVTVNNLTVEESVIGKLLSRLMDMDKKEIYEYLSANALGITDVKELRTLEEVSMAVMIGDAVLIIDGYDRAIKIKSKGYPMMGLTESRTEKVIRGSREGFADAVKTNTALIRKRMRTPGLKVKERIMGHLSHTTVAIVYIEELVRPSVLKEIERRLDNIDIEELTDTGIIEQLTRENHRTIFPEYQTTERPDKAVEEIGNGRIVLLVDNSPMALLMPTNLAGFFHTADDEYNNPIIVSFERMLRYMAAFVGLLLPAIYLSITSFHCELLSSGLVKRLAQERSTVPFPVVIEVLFMEIAFELLREAGIRIPGYAGSAMSIVGGLIVGQATVSAGLVSPIMVVVVALTALAEYAIPNEELSSAIRLLKYGMILLAAWLGLYGVLLGMLMLMYHLITLKSFNFPYLYPFTGGDMNEDEDLKEAVLKRRAGKRKPMFYQRRKGFPPL